MRPKGLAKTGGRVKGKKNLSTTELRNIFQSLLEANLHTLQLDINSLEPKERLQIVMKIATFCLPTLQSQDIEMKSRENDDVLKSFLANQK